MERLVERRLNTISFRVFMIVTMGLFSAVCFAQLAAPQVSIDIVTIDDVDYARVKWEAVDGALSYNIYASEIADPEEWGDPIARVGANVFEYDLPVNDDRVKLFYVTACEVPPPPAGMVFVQGGTFNPAADYTVNLSSFYIGRYEVTQSEWTSVMGGIYNPNWNYGQGPTHPAYSISWFDAIEYCNRLSIREGLTPAYSYGTSGTNPANWPAGWNTSNANHTNVSCNWNADGYLLPTEMEREFAARGGVPAQQTGTFNDFWAGTDVEAELVNYAWYVDNSDTGAGMQTHPVGEKLSNELGLYDMSGNVWNWVWDIYGNYPTGVHNNPTGLTTGTYRVRRGGSWYYSAARCTVSYRVNSHATLRSLSFGFRVSRRIP